MQEKKGIDWSSLWRVEDWWACWLGWLILILAWVGVVPHTITANFFLPALRLP